MKKTYQIFEIKSKEVLVRSDDYYARGNDSQEETINILEYVFKYDDNDKYITFDSEDDAIKHLQSLSAGKYTILLTYTI